MLRSDQDEGVCFTMDNIRGSTGATLKRRRGHLTVM